MQIVNLLKKQINYLLSFFKKINFFFISLFKKDFYIAHRGLQRNGTNFLLLILKKYGLFVINEIDPKRNKPHHKHCR